MKKNLPKSLRFEKRVMIAGGSIAAVIVISSGYGAAQWGVQRIVRKKVVEVLRSRLGVDAEIDGVSAGISSLTLTGMRTKGHGNRWLSFDIPRVTARFGLPALLLGGSSSIRSIKVDGLKGDVRIGEGLQPVLSRALAATGRGASEKGVARRRTIAINDLSLIVSDGDGKLIRVRGRVAVEEGKEVSAELKKLEIGSGAGSTAVFDGVGLLLAVENRKYKIEKVDIQRMRLELAERARAAKGDPGGMAEGDAAGEQAAVEPTGAPVTPGGGAGRSAGGKTVGTIDRIRRVIATFLRPGHKAVMPRPDGTGAEGRPAHQLLASLGGGLSVTLKQAAVYERSQGERHRLIDDLSGRMVGKGKGEFHLQGRGRARQGGRLSWDFEIWPDRLRAEGSIEVASLPLALIEPFLPEIPWYRPEDARVDAELELGAESVNSLAVRGKAELSKAAIFSERVAPEPIRNIKLSVEGRGHWLPVGRRLEVEEATVSMGKAQVALKGAVELTPSDYLFDLDVDLPSTPCTDAVASIPEDLLAELRGFQWTGSLAGRLRVRVDSRDLEKTEFAIDVADGCEFTRVPAMADLRRFRMPFVHTVLEPDGEVLEMEMGPGTESWTHLEEVSPFLVYAVIAHEDGGFFDHKGFSPAHIHNALIRDLQERRYVVGASTITMQLVKNLFLRREKTLARKVQEVLLTWWVERVMEKRDILELYLNAIEYGPGVYGIRHAARHYFNRLPSELSPAESIYLSMILPNPKRYHVHFESGSIPASWVERMRRALLRMAEKRWYTPDAVEYGLQEIEHFRFTAEGEVPESRQIPGGTGKLPYMQDFDGDWDWEDGAVPGSEDPGGAEGLSERDVIPQEAPGGGERKQGGETGTEQRKPGTEEQPVVR